MVWFGLVWFGLVRYGMEVGFDGCVSFDCGWSPRKNRGSFWAWDKCPTSVRSQVGWPLRAGIDGGISHERLSVYTDTLRLPNAGQRASSYQADLGASDG